MVPCATAIFPRTLVILGLEAKPSRSEKAAGTTLVIPGREAKPSRSEEAAGTI
jgi:hypothetical protein